VPIIAVSEKGRLVIPSAIRASLGISAGTRIEIRIESDGFRAFVKPAQKTRTAESCLGFAQYGGLKLKVAEMDAALFAKKI
jgi:AbrB family looped-hinge helix DNA binding protein